MTRSIDDLKTAAGLLEKAAELVSEAAKVTSLPSEAVRTIRARGSCANSPEVDAAETRSHGPARYGEPEKAKDQKAEQYLAKVLGQLGNSHGLEAPHGERAHPDRGSKR